MQKNKANLKKEYQEVVDFFIKTAPYQHMFFIELIKEHITFSSDNHKEIFTIDEEQEMRFNGPFIQIPIK